MDYFQVCKDRVDFFPFRLNKVCTETSDRYEA